MLVIGQVTVSVTLLIGAGLLIRSLMNLMTTNLGFTAEGLILVHADLRAPGQTERGTVQGYEDAAATIAHLPGITSTSLALVPPISRTDGYWTRELKIDGQLQTLQGPDPVYFNVVGPDFFRTRGIQVLQGRGISVTDGARSPRVAVVSQTLANRYLDGGHALGRTVSVGDRDERQNLQIVGIAQDAKYQTIQDRNAGTVYLSYAQDPKTAETSAFTLEARTAGDVDTLPVTIEQEFRRPNPNVPVIVESAPARIRETLWKERLLATTSASLLALFVAGVGVAGMMARSVTQRWREIGIRMALGATAGNIVRTVVREAILVVAIGAALGTAGALAAARYVSGLLYGIAPADVRTVIGACALMLVVGALAGYVPGRRVLSLDRARCIRDA